jgi:hypothetical protein
LDVTWTLVDQNIRLLAMTFGRPLMIDTSFTTAVPSMIDDELLRTSGEGIQPPTKLTVMGLCVYSCGLFEILADILVAFYSPKCSGKSTSRDGKHSLLTQVLAFDARLDRFFDSVPQSLRTGVGNGSSTPDWNITLQREVLNCRYSSQHQTRFTVLTVSFRFLYTRLLSLRPLLLTTMTMGVNNIQTTVESNIGQLEDHLSQRACSLCISTAHRLIETIYVHLDNLYRSSGWHSVYCKCLHDHEHRPASYKANRVKSHLLQRLYCWLRQDYLLSKTTQQTISSFRGIVALPF